MLRVKDVFSIFKLLYEYTRTINHDIRSIVVIRLKCCVASEIFARVRTYVSVPFAAVITWQKMQKCFILHVTAWHKPLYITRVVCVFA